MRLERYRPRRNHSDRAVKGCGVLSVLIGVVMLVVTAVGLLAPELPALIIQSIGFQEIGETETVFEGVTPVPTVVVQMGEAPPSVIVDAGSYGRERFSGTSSLYDVQVGVDDNSQRMIRVTFEEEDLVSLCQRHSNICADQGVNIRRTTFDLRVGGVVIQTEIYNPDLDLWQGVNLVVQQVGETGFDVAGVDIDGTLYGLPSGQISQTMTQAEDTLRDALTQLTVEAANGVFSLSSIITTDSSVTFVLRESQT